MDVLYPALAEVHLGGGGGRFGSSAMLAFIIAQCGAKVGIMAHRRLISSPFQTRT